MGIEVKPHHNRRNRLQHAHRQPLSGQPSSELRVLAKIVRVPAKLPLVLKVVCALFVTVSLSSCGGTQAGNAVIARVGTASITKHTLEHWMTVMASGEAVPDPPRYTACIAHMEGAAGGSTQARLLQACQQRYLMVQRKALDFLILSAWLVQEADSLHLQSSGSEIERQLHQDETSPTLELHTLLDENRRTRADLEFEATAQVASSRIRAMLAPAITPTEIANYYHEHRSEFVNVERRYFYIDNLASEQEAQAAKRQAESGRTFASMALSEELTRNQDLKPQLGREAIDHAIFAAGLHRLTGPVLLADVKDHSLFELTRIVPASYRPLAEVRGAIAAQLAAQQRQRAEAKFVSAWRARWIDRTDCIPGYIAERCRQYSGSRAPEAKGGLE